MYDVIMKAFGQTVYMVIGSTLFSVILGYPGLYPGDRADGNSTGWSASQ